MRADVGRIDPRHDEVLGSHGRAGEPPQHRELSRVGHRVGKRPLKEIFRSRSLERRSLFEMAREIRKRRMESQDFCLEVGPQGRPVLTADEKGPGISEDAVHVADELVRRPHLRGRSKRREVRRSPAQRFLSAVGDGGKEMAQKRSFVIHDDQVINFRMNASLRPALPRTMGLPLLIGSNQN